MRYCIDYLCDIYIYIYIYIYDIYIWDNLRWPCWPRGHQTRHFRKRATSVPAEGPAYGLDFARHREFPLRALQAQKWHVRRSRTFGAAWLALRARLCWTVRPGSHCSQTKRQAGYSYSYRYYTVCNIIIVIVYTARQPPRAGRQADGQLARPWASQRLKETDIYIYIYMQERAPVRSWKLVGRHRKVALAMAWLWSDYYPTLST